MIKNAANRRLSAGNADLIIEVAMSGGRWSRLSAAQITVTAMSIGTGFVSTSPTAWTATTDPDAIADAIAADVGRTVDYRPVATDGAARAASLIAELM